MVRRSRHALFLSTMLPAFLAPVAAHAGTAYQEVWYPDGQISWFNKDVANAGTNGATLRSAMTFLEARTPLNISEVTSAASANLTFSKGSALAAGSGMTYGYWLQNRADANKVIEFGTGGTISKGTVLHEMMHALGFAHEFQRPEREDFVDMCFNVDGFNYGTIGNVLIPGAHWNLSPYDFGSLTNGGYTCQTPLPGVEQQSSVYHGTDNQLSAHDINSLYRMYQNALGSNVAGDQFGHAIATGDFDDDEVEDIAVAAAEPNGTSTALRIYFYRGVMTDPSEEPGVGTSYVPWFRHSFNSTATAGSKLTLAAGDFNGDGISDLAVGDPSFSSNKGRVRILFVNTGTDDTVKNDNSAPWGLQGIQASTTILPADVGISTLVAGRFGAALAVGKLTARKDVVTDESPYDDLIVGAPTASSLLVGGPIGGAVAHIQGREEPVGSTWTPGGTTLKWNPGSAGDEFGAAVSVVPGLCASSTSATFYNDVYIVGAPGSSSDTGTVRLYGCATDEDETLLSAALLRTVQGAQAGARYGASVAGFRRRQSTTITNYKYYAAVGAPKYVGSGTNPDSGIVYLDEYSLAGVKTFVDSFRPGTRSGADEFGATLAVQQNAVSSTVLEGSNEVYIAIGMPGTKVDGFPAGKVYVWKPWTSTGTLTGTADVVSAAQGTSATTTRFGSALAPLRNLDTNGGFVAGAPLSAEPEVTVSSNGIPTITWINSGSIDVLLNDSTTVWDWSTDRRHVTQETEGDHRPTN